MSGLSQAARKYAAPRIRGLSPYDPAFIECDVNLSANENNYPLPKGIRKAIDEAIANTPTNRYPDAMSNELRDAIAKAYGVERSNVCVGNGGDELLFNCFLAFCGDGRTLVDCPPTFSVYELYSKMVGTRVLNCWRDPRTFGIDFDALEKLAKNADMVVITSPNNPTGNTADPAGIERVIRACKGVVLVDEAYMEFSDPELSFIPRIGEFENLLVLRTFSKAFGMAGLRVGYVLGDPALIEALGAVRQPYSVDVFAQAAALAVIENRDAYVDVIERIKSAREDFAQALGGIPGVEVFPAEGNFLLVRLPEAGIIRRRLANERSVLVRDFSTVQGLEGCLRISVGTPEENVKAVDAIASLIEEVR
ncbi:MAG: histidinol-phosphate transaminase [Atopobiaceae bacterium]|nr:histidinol-phosphate transaminase [Atopobiaceae bacterium]